MTVGSAKDPVLTPPAPGVTFMSKHPRSGVWSTCDPCDRWTKCLAPEWNPALAGAEPTCVAARLLQLALQLLTGALPARGPFRAAEASPHNAELCAAADLRARPLGLAPLPLHLP